jgi:hypothetical protein
MYGNILSFITSASPVNYAHSFLREIWQRVFFSEDPWGLWISSSMSTDFYNLSPISENEELG